MTDASEKDDDLLAAEYVLRLLAPDDARAFERRLATDHGAQQSVARWEAYFAGLNDEFAEVVPPKSVKIGVQERLFGAPPRRVPLWQRAGIWQGISFASLAVAGFFAAQNLTVPGPQTGARGPVYVSEIAAADASLRVLALYAPEAGELRITRTAGAAQDGRALELWAIAGDAAPVSLGVLPGEAKAVVTLPEGLRAGVATLVLAISDEPPGGSLTGAPTGAVLAVGQVTEL
ncbi:anti-sigma factor [Thalassovita taeanensis]|uniref:Anti-sigma-K factor RskA n=1 Tax=Thalassovita taeanensis TaxID=657014 RepID=A0A1H9JSF8_9RHOB|nr:anti-sigma factor [Thalassovita taeanensis]SEQ89728.1 Anti-sigma-K factor RskA [Thalassovita taeanensis]